MTTTSALAISIIAGFGFVTTFVVISLFIFLRFSDLKTEDNLQLLELAEYRFVRSAAGETSFYVWVMLMILFISIEILMVAYLLFRSGIIIYTGAITTIVTLFLLLFFILSSTVKSTMINESGIKALRSYLATDSHAESSTKVSDNHPKKSRQAKVPLSDRDSHSQASTGFPSAVRETSTSIQDAVQRANVGEIDIEISEGDLEGQFDKIEEELSLSSLEREIIEIAIRELVDRTVEEHDFDLDAEMKNATANVIASTLIQEYKKRIKE